MPRLTNAGPPAKKATARPKPKPRGDSTTEPVHVQEALGAVLEGLEAPPAADTAPEPESATEAPTEATDDKPKPLRPRTAVRPAPGVLMNAFRPDLSKLVPLSDKADYLRGVLYGDHGTGKTTSLASLAQRGKVAIIDPENSVRLGALKRRGVHTDNILVWTDWSVEGVQQFYHTVKDQLDREPGSIFAVGIDTVSALSQYWLEAEVQGQLKRPTMKSKNPERDQWDFYQEDYGVMAEQVKSVITRQLFSLPCHVFVLAHTRRAENEEGAVRVGPALSPAAQAALLTYSDWVFRLTRTERGGNVQRVIDTAPRGNVEAKDRFGVFNERLTDASLLDMLEVWEADQ